MEDDSTQELLERWHRGDQAALHTLVARDLEWVRSRVRKRLGGLLRRKGVTEDYVQEAMVRILRYKPRFVVSDRGHFRGLMVRLVENVLRDESDRYRALQRAADRERALPRDSVLQLTTPTESSRPSRILQREERKEWVRLGLELLEPEQREIIVLREFEGLSFDELGSRLSISKDAARMRFHRALPELAERVRSLRSGELDDLLA